MTKTDVIYALEQGIKSPRDGTVNYQNYDWFGSLAAAKREATGNGYWRIVRQETVWTKEPETT